MIQWCNAMKKHLVLADEKRQNFLKSNKKLVVAIEIVTRCAYLYGLRSFMAITILRHISILRLYSIIKQRGKCSRRYSNSSWDAPGQLVSSSSCKWRNWIMLDNPLDVNNGHPTNKNKTKKRGKTSIHSICVVAFDKLIVIENCDAMSKCVKYLPRKVSVDSASNIDVAIQNRALVNTSAGTEQSTTASSIYNQRQYPLYERIWIESIGLCINLLLSIGFWMNRYSFIQFFILNFFN